MMIMYVFVVRVVMRTNDLINQIICDTFEWHAGLVASSVCVAHFLDDCRALRNFVFTDNHGICGTTSVRAFHLRLEAADTGRCRAMQYHIESGITQTFRYD